MTVKYELIVAMNQDGIIGLTDVSGNQRIPSWSSVIGSVDMRHFRETTTTPEGHILVMGRKTFESLPNGKPLSDRIHVVITRTPSKYDEILPTKTRWVFSGESSNFSRFASGVLRRFKDNEFVFFTRLEYLDNLLKSIGRVHSSKKVFVCGGEEIYRALLPRCEKLHITVIEFPIRLEIGETVSRFPSLDEISKDFRETETLERDRCVFKKYECL
jgi:dihydrofolate reductase